MFDPAFGGFIQCVDPYVFLHGFLFHCRWFPETRDFKEKTGLRKIENKKPALSFEKREF